MPFAIDAVLRTRLPRALAAIAMTFAVASTAGAATFNYNRTTSNTLATPDLWSAGTNWDAAPVSAADTTLVLNGTAGAIFLNDDIAGNFLLNVLTLNNSASGGQITVSGNPLEFVSNGAVTPVLNSTPSGSTTPIENLNNNLVLTSSLVVNTTSKLFLNGAISGAGTFTKGSTGQTVSALTSVEYVSNTANSYSGGTVINVGIVQFTKAAAMPASGTVTVTGGAAINATTSTLAINVGGAGEFTTATSGAGSIGGILSGIGGQGAAVVINSGGGLALDTTNNGGGASVYSGDITNAGLRLVKLGTNTLTLTGTNTNTGGSVYLSGNTTNSNTTTTSSGLSIQAGTVSVSSIGNKNATSSNIGGAYNSIMFGTGGTLQYTGTGETTDRQIAPYISTSSLVLDQSGTGLLRFTSNPLLGSANGSGNAPKAFTFQGSTAGMGQFDGVITDSFYGTLVNRSNSLVKSGTGTWVITGANTFSGGTTINAGTLSVSSIGNSLSVSSNLGGATQTSFGSGGPIQGFSTPTIKMGSTTSTGTLLYTGAGETTDRFVSLTGTTGGATLDQSGTGALVFSTDFTAPGVASTDQRKTLTLQGSTSGTGEIAGKIVDSTLGTTLQKATSVAKTGTGKWTLSGANTYTGATTVTGGTLAVGATGTINTSSGVTVSGGAFRYDGTTALTPNVTVAGGAFRYNSAANFAGGLTFTNGSVGGTNLSNFNITIASGQTIAPGNSTGALATGNTTFANGGAFQFEINDALGTAGSTTAGWDLLNPNSLNLTAGAGQFTLQLVSLDASQSPGLAQNFVGTNSYSFLLVDAAAPITGFSPSEFAFNLGGFQNSAPGVFSVFQGLGVDSDKLYLNYTAVPEPSTWALLIGGVAVLVVPRRLRRRVG